MILLGNNAKTALTRQLYKKGYSKKDIYQLLILLDWLVTLPEELMLKYHNALEEIEEERKVELSDFVTTPERVGRMRGFQEGL